MRLLNFWFVMIWSPEDQELFFEFGRLEPVDFNAQNRTLNNDQFSHKKEDLQYMHKATVYHLVSVGVGTILVLSVDKLENGDLLWLAPSRLLPTNTNTKLLLRSLCHLCMQIYAWSVFFFRIGNLFAPIFASSLYVMLLCSIQRCTYLLLG